jgi:16S rRNA (uracil1498-N3)-methyltransferase
MNQNGDSMSRTRIFQSASLEPHSNLRLDENASHHLARVLRAKIDDTLTLFNGNGNEYEAVISHIDKKGVDVEIKNSKPCDTESPIDIYLAQGIARGEKMDFIVQKAVELGVKKIFPLITERCNVRLEGEREDKRLRHWQSVIVSACEQSGRARLPEMTAPQTLTEWLAGVQANLCFVLSPYAQDKLPTTAFAHASIVLLIGPEGGLSDNEISLATQKDFKPVNLGPRILRTETATVAALTAIQFRYGDFG